MLNITKWNQTMWCYGAKKQLWRVVSCHRWFKWLCMCQKFCVLCPTCAHINWTYVFHHLTPLHYYNSNPVYHYSCRIYFFPANLLIWFSTKKHTVNQNGMNIWIGFYSFLLRLHPVLSADIGIKVVDSMADFQSLAARYEITTKRHLHSTLAIVREMGGSATPL